MICPACGHENPAAAKFCAQCAAALRLVCPECGTENVPGSKFCNECAHPLPGSSVPVQLTPVAPAPTPMPPEPASFSNGRYEVKRFLGEGGKKRVYLAHDTLLDRDVAFALIKAEGLDDLGRERVRREAQAMGRLGTHAHIVSVFDLGDEQGQPYMVTELMGGGDVEGLIEKAEGHRLGLDQALRIADEVCQGLEFAQEHHLVHRDLKPGNVWLTADGVAKIGDFGLAVATDRSRLTQAGMMVGTVSYMPPEQALGGEVTPRSDLYSLGAMLYEMVTGRPPFVGDESVAIITQHLNTPPVAPSWHNPELPKGLETLILQLLEKDASKRPVSASEVRAALANVSLTATLSRRDGEQSLPPLPLGEGGGEGRAQNPLYRRTFVGREAELKQLQRAFDGTLSGRGALMAVVGEPGIGKTALCEQLATYAAMRGGRTLVGHAYEEGSLSLPYLPFVEAMQSYVLARPPEALREELGSGAQEVARIVSEIRQRVGIEPSAPMGIDPQEERWRLFQAVTGFLRNASAVQPLVIVLEDLHWADRGTLELLVHLARSLEGARLLIVGTYRDIEVDRAHPLSSALAELRRGATFDRVLLRGLSADEVQRMLQGITGQEMRWGFAEAVHRQTEGNPLFVQEVIRYLAEEGLITHEAGRWQRAGATPLEMSIPEGLRDVIGKRLSRLSPECNRILNVAAVVGRDFAMETLQAVAGVEEDPLVEALEEAVRVGVLDEQSRFGVIRYRFAHAFFRQTLYEELSAPRRLRLHQQVARALEGQYAARLHEHAAELAEHFAQSTDPADLRKAVEYGEVAARRAVEVNAYGEAAQHLERALDVQEVLDPDDQSRRCDLLLSLGAVLGPAGEPRRVYEQIAPEAFALAQRLDDRRRASRACHTVLDAMGQYAGATGQRLVSYPLWVERADRYAESDSAERVMADLARANVSYQNAHFAESRRLVRSALQLARQLSDPEAFLRAAHETLSTRGAAHDDAERLRLAEELHERPREGVSSQYLRAALSFCQERFLAAGHRARADHIGRDLAGMAARTSNVDLMFLPFEETALAATLDGRFDDALEATQQLLDRADELGMAVRGRQSVEGLSAYPLLCLGRFDEALGSVFQSERAAGVTTPVFNLRIARRPRYLAQAGRIDEARAALHELLARLPISGDDDDPPAGVVVDLLETAVAVEDRGAAARLSLALGDVVAVVNNNFCVTSVARHQGAAAALLGDRSGARAHYDRSLAWATAIRFRPEVALARLQIAELLLVGDAQEQAEAQRHLDFAIEELRAMKMQPSLERALRHKGLLHA